MANWTFDPSQYKESNFQVIPVGDYRARIIDVVEKIFSTGNEGYEMTLEINGYNSRLWYRLVLDKSNPASTNQRIGDFFDSFGITNTAMGTGKQWVGAVGAVRVKQGEFNGTTRPEVAYCISRSRQETLPAWKNTTTTAAAAPAMSAPTINPNDLPFDM